MAKAIEFVYKPQDHEGPRDVQKLRELEKAPLQHYDALLDLWQTLDAAHRSHALETLRGAMLSAGYISGEVAGALNTEAAIRGMRNVIMLTEMVGSLDPEALHAVVKALPPAVGKAGEAARVGKPPSVFALARMFFSAESRRAMGVMGALLQAFGAGFGSEKR